MNIADTTLELQVYVLLSELFHRLCDFEKSARYASKAYDLSRSLQLGDLNSRHHRAALLRMASALRKQGELGDARDYVEEATRLALISGDQASYTRSIRIMGDIYRKKLDIDVRRDDNSFALFSPYLFFFCSEHLGNMNKQWALLPIWQIECRKWKQWMALRAAWSHFGCR